MWYFRRRATNETIIHTRLHLGPHSFFLSYASIAYEILDCQFCLFNLKISNFSFCNQIIFLTISAELGHYILVNIQSSSFWMLASSNWNGKEFQDQLWFARKGNTFLHYYFSFSYLVLIRLQKLSCLHIYIFRCVFCTDIFVISTPQFTRFLILNEGANKALCKTCSFSTATSVLLWCDQRIV